MSASQFVVFMCTVCVLVARAAAHTMHAPHRTDARHHKRTYRAICKCAEYRNNRERVNYNNPVFMYSPARVRLRACACSRACLRARIRVSVTVWPCACVRVCLRPYSCVCDRLVCLQPPARRSSASCVRTTRSAPCSRFRESSRASAPTSSTANTASSVSKNRADTALHTLVSLTRSHVRALSSLPDFPRWLAGPLARWPAGPLTGWPACPTHPIGCTTSTRVYLQNVLYDTSCPVFYWFSHRTRA